MTRGWRIGEGDQRRREGVFEVGRVEGRGVCSRRGGGKGCLQLEGWREGGCLQLEGPTTIKGWQSDGWRPYHSEQRRHVREEQVGQDQHGPVPAGADVCASARHASRSAPEYMASVCKYIA